MCERRDMYKLLVADYEDRIVHVIEEIVKKNKMDIQIIGGFQTGSEALKSALKLKPEILVLDVYLKEINGIELAKKLCARYNKVHIIFLSSSSDYQYLREAILLSAEDYLLKPVKQIEVKRVLKQVIQKLEKEKKQEEYYTQKINLQDEIAALIENNFIYTTLFNSYFGEELERYQPILNIGRMGYIYNVEIISPPISEYDIMNWGQKELYYCMKKTISEITPSVIGPLIVNRILIYVNSNEKLTNNKSKEIAIQLAKSICCSLKKKLNITARIGIGSRSRIEDIHVSYQESICCLRYQKKESIIMISDLEEKEIINYYKEYRTLEDKLLETVRFDNKEAIKVFNEIMTLLQQLSYQEQANKIAELLLLVCHEIRSYTRNEVEFMNYIAYFEEMQTLSGDEIFVWAYKKFQFLLKSIQTFRIEKHTQAVSEVIKYVKSNLTDEITLEEVSKRVGISSQYFSKVFKEEMGIGFLDWLTTQRINLAKELLLNNDTIVKEICYKVGYNDPNYFSRLFKKKVGMSPSAYVKQKKELKKGKKSRA